MVPTTTTLGFAHLNSLGISTSLDRLPMTMLAAQPEPLLQKVAVAVAVAADDSSITERNFEPMLPDTTTLLGMGLIVVLCVLASQVWSNQVVPVSRTKLALSKRNGDVKEYLDDLKQADPEERRFEQWLFTDWLVKRKNKDTALPFLKKAKWNSGDNPVVVTSALLIIGILIASATERVWIP